MNIVWEVHTSSSKWLYMHCQCQNNRHQSNLISSVLRLLGQWVVARKDSGVLEVFIAKNPLVTGS